MNRPNTLPDREVVKRLRTLTRRKIFGEAGTLAVPVKTWCRKCSLPVLLNVYKDYELAKRHFYALDDQAMVHKNVHAEVGGWGVHWRLDDVLAALFPQHAEACWPKPSWYEYAESEDFNILVLKPTDVEEHASGAGMDVELKMLLEAINRVPRGREDLENGMGQVWDDAEVRDRFEVLGFRAPFVVVRDKETGERGSLLFQNHPRFYFGFSPERAI
jgi:hypothetical protein